MKESEWIAVIEGHVEKVATSIEETRFSIVTLGMQAALHSEQASYTRTIAAKLAEYRQWLTENGR